MKDMRSAIISYMKEFSFKDEELTETPSIFDEISKNDGAMELLLPLYTRYRDEHELEFEVLTKECLPKVCELTGLHRYRVNLPVMAAFAPHSRYFYDKLGVSYKIWRDSMMDIKWKLNECVLTCGFIGSRASDWFKGWYYANRLTFHRLQFELAYARADFKKGGFDIKEGDQIIGLHIPSDTTIPFDKENRDISYGLASEYFSQFFDKKPIPLRCSSWLLAPFHSEILPEGANIREFEEEFTKGPSAQTRGDLWRIFNTETLPEDKDLPENTKLQRAYKKFILAGGEPCSTTGYRYI